MKRLIVVALVILGAPVIAAPQYDVTGRDKSLPSGPSNPVAVQIEATTVPLSITPTAVSQANMTSVTAAIPAVSTSVNLTAASTHLIIKSDAGSANLFVNLANGTATTSNFKIEAGGSLSLDNMSAISQFKIIGDAAVGNYSVVAW